VKILWLALGFAFMLLISLAVYEIRLWDEFREKHKCRVVAHVSGDVINTFGVGANGQVVVGIGVTPSKTGWLCDDGKTYYR
jgi:hypothetical protein